MNINLYQMQNFDKSQNSSYNLNFCAEFKLNTVVKRRKMFSYKNQNASIVELNCADANDILALSKTAYNWKQKGGEIINNIFLENLESTKNWNRPSEVSKVHYYILTTQDKNYQNLNPDNILGIMEFLEKKTPYNEIYSLEVKPNTIKKKLFRKYKNVGKKLIEFVQKEHKDKDIEVISVPDAINFYKKLGFEQRPKFSHKHLFWMT